GCSLLTLLIIHFSLASLSSIVFFLMLCRPPRSTFFPYTTLFRSLAWLSPTILAMIGSAVALGLGFVWHAKRADEPFLPLSLMGRSEEHTSELQSHLNLVCRLLLEKKKKTLRLV